MQIHTLAQILAHLFTSLYVYTNSHIHSMAKLIEGLCVEISSQFSHQQRLMCSAHTQHRSVAKRFTRKSSIEIQKIENTFHFPRFFCVQINEITILIMQLIIKSIDFALSIQVRSRCTHTPLNFDVSMWMRWGLKLKCDWPWLQLLNGFFFWISSRILIVSEITYTHTLQW